MRFLLLKSLLILFYCSFGFALTLKAQTIRPNYNLLWKISGNGMKKPSYLFGTMHLKDKRVFDFSDSVLVKLSECSSFALEVHPDTLIKTLYEKNRNKQINKKYSSDYYKDKLSKDEYNTLKERVKAETGNSLEDIPNQSPSVINFLLKRSAKSKAEKNTFLDAYLYYLARVQGKQIFGIEKMNEHVNDMDSLGNEVQFNEIQRKLNTDSQASFEKFISLYQNGDIEKLYNVFSNSDDSQLKEMVRRNTTMTRRIDSLIQSQSIFIAVGAAHLAGENGLIQLLKSKGYSVSPVSAAFTGLALKFSVNPEKDPWTKFAPPSGLYDVELPSNPNEMVLSETGLGSMFTYYDLGTGLAYFVIGIPTLEDFNMEANREKVLKQFLKNAVEKQKNKIISQKKIIYEGKNGYEIRFSNVSSTLFFKIRLLFNDNIQYLLMAGGEGIHYLEIKDISRFFNSFKTNAILPNDWEVFNNEKGAFSIKMPAPVIKDSIIGNDIKVYTFSAQSIKDGKAYAVFHTQFPNGHYINNDSSYFEILIKNTLKQINGKLKFKSFSEIEGMPCLEYAANFNNSFLYYNKVFLRGNRAYLLTMVTSEKDSLSIEKKAFYNSFAFTPFLKSNGTTYTPDDKSFSISFPGLPTIINDSLSSESLQTTQYYLNDPMTDLPYYLNISTASPYLYYENSDTLFNRLRKNIVEVGDTITYEKKSGTSAEPAIEWVIESKRSHLETRRKMIAKNNKIYEIFTFQPKKEVFSPDVNVYFNSFKINETTGKGNLFTDKITLLLADLASSDTTLQNRAYLAINWYNFTKNDTKPILEALEKKYPDDTLQFNGTRQNLLNHIDFLDEPAIFSLITKIYPELPPKGGLQTAALRRLIKSRSKTSLLKLVDLLIEKPLKDSTQWFYLYLGDSLANAKVLYPKIYKLLNQKGIRASVYSLTLDALDSNIIAKSDLLPIKEKIIAEINTFLIQNKTATNETDESNVLTYLLDILAYFPEDPVYEKLLRSSMDYKDIFIKWQAMKSLLKNGFKVESKYLEIIAADSYWRVEMYEWLKDNKKLSLFPKKYLRQELFAESFLIHAINEEVDIPTQIKLIEKRTVTYRDKKGIAYLFKFEVTGEDGKSVWYTGISGLFPSDKNKMLGDWLLTYSNFETLDSKSINEHFNSYLNPPPPPPDVEVEEE